MGINLPGLDQLLFSALFSLVATASTLLAQPQIISPLAGSGVVTTTKGTEIRTPNPSDTPVLEGNSNQTGQTDPTGTVAGASIVNHTVHQEVISGSSNTTWSSTTNTDTNQTSQDQQTTQSSSSVNNTSTPLAPTNIVSTKTAASLIIPQALTAKTTITSKGKTIHLSITAPGKGGAITGSMSGDCRGSVGGTYAGPSSGNLSGTVNATCPAGFLSIPVTISYSGKISSSDTQASIHYTASALGQKESGNTTMAIGQ